MSDTPKTLVAKLAAVMAVVERVPKNGYNDFHRYRYAMEADIVAVVRQELASRHVMLVPSVESMQREPVGEKGQILTTLTMTFTFLDGESGETLTRSWIGAGTDKEDKGAYKAMTGGEKYFLLKTFLMPTGDDPEADDQPKHTAKGSEERREQVQASGSSTKAVVAAMRRPTPGKSSGVRVASIDKRNGSSAKGPWTLTIIKFSDGREGTTFSSSIADAAADASEMSAEVDITLVPGKKPGSFEVMSLMPVRQLREDLSGGIAPGEVPPWMRDEEEASA